MIKSLIALIFLVSFLTHSHSNPVGSNCGIASVFGNENHQNKTATGAAYHPWAQAIVAHKTLPLGTIIHVTNQRNGKSIDVKVGNRGPYVKGRILDFSYLAAKMLGEGTNSTFLVCFTIQRS